MKIIKYVSLLLGPKYGNTLDYNLILEVYSADSSGMPYGPILSTSIKPSSQVSIRDWYNFELNNTVYADDNEKLAFIFYQDKYDDNNFVPWIRSNYNENNNYSTIYLSSNNQDYGYVGSQFGYGYAYNSSFGMDFFDLIGYVGDFGYDTFDATKTGYEIENVSTIGNYDYGYGYEYGYFDISQKTSFCIKVYENYNDIVSDIYSGDDVKKVNVPTDEQEQYIIIDNKQEFLKSKRYRTSIYGDRLALSNMGERIYFSDYSNKNNSWLSSNRGLSSNQVTGFDIKCLDVSPYNCKCLAFCEDSGLFISNNSGADWEEFLESDLTEFLENKKVTDIKFLHNENVFALAVYDNFSNYIIISNNLGDILYNSSSIGDNSKLYYNRTNFGIGEIGYLYIYNETYVDKGRRLSIEIRNDNLLPIINDDDFDIVGHNIINDVQHLNINSGGVDDYIILVATDNKYSIVFYESGIHTQINGVGDKECNTIKSSWHDDNDTFIIYLGQNADNTYKNKLLQRVYKLSTKSLDPDYDYQNFSTTGLPSSNFIKIDIRNNIYKNYISIQNNQRIIIWQVNGVSISYDGGVTFVSYNKDLNDRNITYGAVNPIDDYIVYSIVSNTYKVIPSISFMFDLSGSMIDSNKLGDRFSLAKSIVNEIYSQNNNALFQIVVFGLPQQKNYNQIYSKLEQDQPIFVDGNANLTNGFINDITRLNQLFDILSDNRHYATPLTDSLYVTIKGIVLDGTPWIYIENGVIDGQLIEKQFVFPNYRSDTFLYSDKIIVLFSDGLENKSKNKIEGGKDTLTRTKELLQNLSAKLYIVALGPNIDYEYLSQISSSIIDGELLMSQNDRFISDEISDYLYYSIVNRVREGEFEKDIIFDTNKKVKTIKINANIPDNTNVFVYYKYRNKFVEFTKWYGNYDANIDINIDEITNWVSIKLILSSSVINKSPEINSIYIEYNDLLYSNIFLDAIEIDNGLLIDAVNSLNLYKTDNTNISAFMSQGETRNSNALVPINLDRHSVYNSRLFENMASTDGYNFYTSNGAWPETIEYNTISVYVGENEISSKNYKLFPQEGRVFFFDNISLYSKVKISIPYTNIYQFMLRLNTYSSDNVYLRDLSFNYLLDKSTTLANRQALPLLASQIEGVSSVTPHIIKRNSNSSFTITIIVPELIDNEDYDGLNINDIIYITNTSKINYNDVNYLFGHDAKQFAIPQFTNPTDINYVNIEVIGKPNVVFQSEVLSDNNIYSLFGINPNTISIVAFKIINGNIEANDVIRINWGGVTGFDSDLQRNDEFVNGPTFGLINTVFSFKFSNNSNWFFSDPNVQYSGDIFNSYRIFVPATINTNTFKAKVFPIDATNMIVFDNNKSFYYAKQQTDTNLTIASFPISGSEVIEIEVVRDNSSDVQYLSVFDENGELKGSSNPFFVNYDKNLYFGDLNVKSSISLARHNINYIVNYAKNIIGLDFISIVEDVDKLDSNNYNLFRNLTIELNNESSFLVFPGISYKVSNPSDSTVGIGIRDVIFAESLPATLQNIDLDSFNGMANLQNIYSSDLKYFININHPAYNPVYENPQDLIYQNQIRNRNYSWIKNANSWNGKELLSEAYTNHGSSVIFGDNYLLNNSAELSKRAYITNAWEYGYRIGVSGGSNDLSSLPGYHPGEFWRSEDNYPDTLVEGNVRGLTAIWADELTRDSLYESIQNIRTYVTTGARIFVDFYAYDNDHLGQKQYIIGDNILLNSDKDFTFNIKAYASDPSLTISRIELYRGKIGELDSNTLLLTINNFSTLEYVYNYRYFVNNKDENSYFIWAKITQSDGHIAWTSPIWINWEKIRLDLINAYIEKGSLIKYDNLLDDFSIQQNMLLSKRGVTYSISSNSIDTNNDNEGYQEISLDNTQYILLDTRNDKPSCGGNIGRIFIDKINKKYINKIFYIYVDDAVTPKYMGEIRDFFSKNQNSNNSYLSTQPTPYTLTKVNNNIYSDNYTMISYSPITFSKFIIIAFEKKDTDKVKDGVPILDFYYEINYTLYDDGIDAEEFSFDISDETKSKLLTANSTYGNKSISKGIYTQSIYESLVWDNENDSKYNYPILLTEIDNIGGGGVLRDISIKICDVNGDDITDINYIKNIINKTALCCHYIKANRPADLQILRDGRTPSNSTTPSFHVPMGAFFCNHFTYEEIKSTFVELQFPNILRFNLPMWFDDYIAFSVKNLSTETILCTFKIDYKLSYPNFSSSLSNRNYLFARFVNINQGGNVDNNLFNILSLPTDASNSGHLGGIYLYNSLDNVKYKYLDSDVIITLEREDNNQKILYSTGLDNFINGSYNFTGFINSYYNPYDGLVSKIETSEGSAVSGYRFFNIDSINWKNSIDLNIEYNSISVPYQPYISAVVYWYQQKKTSSIIDVFPTYNDIIPTVF